MTLPSLRAAVAHAMSPIALATAWLVVATLKWLNV
jgi:hypothetical protein